MQLQGRSAAARDLWVVTAAPAAHAKWLHAIRRSKDVARSQPSFSAVMQRHNIHQGPTLGADAVELRAAEHPMTPPPKE